MRVAKLSADHKFRSIHLPEVIAGDDTAGLDLQLFSGHQAIGDAWHPRGVVYLKEIPQSNSEYCDSATDELSNQWDASCPIGDFPHFWAINFGVLTERAIEALHDLINPYVEFLPLHSDVGHFTAFKVLHFVDALNRNESMIEWFPQLKKDVGRPRVVRQIKKFVFHENRLENEVIFRIPELPFGTEVFVTDRFMDVITEHRLKGFQFLHVWPQIDERDYYAQKRLAKRSRRPQ